MRPRRVLIGAVAAASAALVLAGLGGTMGTASSSSVPATTIALASGEPPPPASGAAATDARQALRAVWPAAQIGETVEVVDDDRNLLSVFGTREDHSTFKLTIYRKFEAEELDSAGLETVAIEKGRAWVGATDDDLTSVYFLDGDIGLRLGIQPLPGQKAESVTHVIEAIQQFAGTPEVAAIARGESK